jgi:C_GCAxxG_C_C family probable redox protein
MSNVEDAVACFAEGFNCSQAVLAAFAPGLGLPRDSALKVAAAFGGGMALKADACGAVTGALMAIGLRHGATAGGDQAAKRQTYDLAAEFLRRFQAKHGSIVCRTLLGFDLGTPEGWKQAVEKNVHGTVCPAFVRTAAAILAEIL